MLWHRVCVDLHVRHSLRRAGKRTLGLWHFLRTVDSHGFDAIPLNRPFITEVVDQVSGRMAMG